MMSTMDGYAEAGRLLKEKSGGEVYLSYIDPAQIPGAIGGEGD